MEENIIKLEYQGKEIYLVKTAHVSKNSVEDVNRIIEEVNPDSICIELDEDRYNSITNKKKWRDTSLSEIIKNGQVAFLLVNCILASFQRRLANNMDSSSGAEMLEGIKLAKEKNADLVLADRNIKKTFTRIWQKLKGKEKIKLIAAIISSIFDDEEVSEEDLAKLKEADALEEALKEVSKEFPKVTEVLVDERDQYLTEKIRTAKGPKIVAIIGAAHSIGIEKHLNDQIDINELDYVGPKNKFSLKKWILPILIIGIIIYTIINNRDMGIAQLKSWIIWNGSLSALGVLLALGHPLSIITAFIAAPLTSLNPLLASGWFAGLVEAYIRKPKVSDFEDMSTDTETLKGFWKNKITRTLLVVLFANLFSSIGTLISGIDIVKKFIETL